MLDFHARLLGLLRLRVVFRGFVHMCLTCGCVLLPFLVYWRRPGRGFAAAAAVRVRLTLAAAQPVFPLSSVRLHASCLFERLFVIRFRPNVTQTFCSERVRMQNQSSTVHSMNSARNGQLNTQSQGVGAPIHCRIDVQRRKRAEAAP